MLCGGKGPVRTFSSPKTGAYATFPGEAAPGVLQPGPRYAPDQKLFELNPDHFPDQTGKRVFGYSLFERAQIALKAKFSIEEMQIIEECRKQDIAAEKQWQAALRMACLILGSDPDLKQAVQIAGDIIPPRDPRVDEVNRSLIAHYYDDIPAPTLDSIYPPPKTATVAAERPGATSDAQASIGFKGNSDGEEPGEAELSDEEKIALARLVDVADTMPMGPRVMLALMRQRISEPIISLAQNLNAMWGVYDNAPWSLELSRSTDTGRIKRTMKMLELLVDARAREMGTSRQNITVIVLGHGGNLMEILPWAELGVKVITTEMGKGDVTALRDKLKARGLDFPNLEIKEAGDLNVPKGDIVVVNHPMNRYMDGESEITSQFSPKDFTAPLKNDGYLLVQSDLLEWYIYPFFTQPEYLLIFRNMLRGDGDYLLPSIHSNAGEVILLKWTKQAP